MEEKKQYKKTVTADFTDGPVLSKVVLFAAPLFLSNLMQILYNMADMAVVGRVCGQTGLAAVSVGGDITNCLTVVMMGFATASQVIISQLLGAGQREKIGGFIGTMAVFFTACAVIVSVLCLAFRSQMLLWMSTPEDAWEEAMRYVTVSLSGLVFLCGYNVISAVLRGLGDSRHPFLYITVASVLNVILDIVFVKYFQWGAAGAAAGTVLAQAASFLMGLSFLWRKREVIGISLGKECFRIDRKMLGLLIRQGIPLAMKSAAVQFTRLFTNSFINSYGAAVCAASGVTGKVNSISNLFSDSLNTSGATMIGQNIGRERYGRVLKILRYMLLITLPVSFVLSICIIWKPNAVFGIFTDEAEVIAICLGYVPIAVMGFFSSAVRSTMNALINGSGNYKVNFLVAILDAFVLRVGLGMFLGLAAGMKYIGFWLGDAVASYTPCVIGIGLLISGKWKTNKYVIEKETAKS